MIHTFISIQKNQTQSASLFPSIEIKEVVSTPSQKQSSCNEREKFFSGRNRNWRRLTMFPMTPLFTSNNDRETPNEMGAFDR